MRQREFAKRSVDCRENTNNGLELLFREGKIIINKLELIIQRILAVFLETQFSADKLYFFFATGRKKSLWAHFKGTKQRKNREMCDKNII